MKKIISLSLFIFLGSILSSSWEGSGIDLLFSQSGRGVLPQNTKIPVKFIKKVNSNDKLEAEIVVASDVNDEEGNKLIASGAPVNANIEKVISKAVGKPGNISVTFISTVAIDGQKIDLSGGHNEFGKDRSGAAWAWTVVGCLVIPPWFTGPLFLLIKGKPAEINESTLVDDIRPATTYKINTGKESAGNKLSMENNDNQTQYRGGGDPLKGLNINKTTTMQIGDYYALIVGVDNYSGSWQPLKNAVRDAKAVEALLKEEYKFDYFKTLYDDQATRKSIISEMEWLVKNVKEKDNVLIYYSGHGEYKQDLNKGYWVPIDAQSTSTSDYVSNNDIQTFLSGIKSKHTLLISDACFSGDIFRGNTIAVPFENSERYYRDVHNLPSRQALTSGGIEPVMDGGKDGHSVFAYYLLKALINNQNNFYDASQLFSTIKIPVTNNSEQSPQFQSIKNTGDEGGQFIFIKK